MKIKRLLAWILVLSMCLGLAACSDGKDKESTSQEKTDKQTSESTELTVQGSTDVSEGESDTEEATDDSDVIQTEVLSPLLYRVTDSDGDVIWLFGSIHVGREDFFPLPDYVTDAYENADSLAVEADIVAFGNDTSLQMQALRSLVYLDGTTITDHIPEELYESAVEMLDDLGFYNAALDMYCPFFWATMIDSLMMEEMGARSDLGIDMFLLETAYEEGKEIIEIESVEFQYEMIGGFDDEVQNMFLEMTVEGYESYDSMAELETMMDLWASGNEKAFAEYLVTDYSEMTEEEKEIYKRYEKAMITDRNISMADFAEDALESGDEVFICVGAAHVVGDGAMADLLEERGYTVECITAF